MMTLIGGQDMDMLFTHTGLVGDADTYTDAIRKVRNAITAQTNQSMAIFKLMREMPQSGRVFSEWWPKVKEQADSVCWTVMMPRWPPAMPSSSSVMTKNCRRG